MTTQPFAVTIYYDDTDLTGLVYHPNYLKYCERARSDFFGPENLWRMQQVDKISVAVYRLDMMFKKGAVLGDKLEVHSHPRLEGDYRVVFNQKIQRADDQTLMVEVNVELVCIANERVIKVPQWLVDRIAEL